MMLDAFKAYDQRLSDDLREILSSAQGDLHAVQEDRKHELIALRYDELQRTEPSFFAMLGKDIDWNNIEPRLKFVSTDAESMLWLYIRNVVSSFPYDGTYGRRFDYYIVDENSGRWLGIVRLASPMQSIKPRDSFLGWKIEDRLPRLVNVLNMVVCVSVQPFGLLCGGKLLAVSSLSDEVRTYYKEKYGDDLLAVEVTSIYGKSSQYNRLKDFAYLGLTLGYGTINLTQELRGKLKSYLELHPDVNKTGEHCVAMRQVNRVSRDLDVGNADKHGHQRGVYWGETAENSRAILLGSDEPPKFIERPFQQIVSVWRDRWYQMRMGKKMDEVKSFDYSQYKLSRFVGIEQPGLFDTLLTF